jgi:predicted phosphodiesterase
MAELGDLLLSCWIVETARSSSLGRRGHGEAASASAERARILASRLEQEGVATVPEYPAQHTEWMAGMAGSMQETGALGLIFLQRIGMFVNAYTRDLLDPEAHKKMVKLAEPELDEANQALAMGTLFPPPPPEWPAAPEARAPGKVLARFGILGDPHVGLEETNRMVAKALAHFSDEGVDFVVAIGDLTHSGGAEQFDQARQLFDAAPFPVAVTLGNHDMFGTQRGETAGLDRFTAAFQRKPYGIHESTGARAIVLNSADPTRSPFPPFDMMQGEFKEAPKYCQSVPGGTFSDEVLVWMAGIEQKEKPTFIFLHHPPYPYLSMPPLVFGLDQPSTAALADLVRRVGAKAVFVGHTHRCAVTELEGVPVVEVASSNDWPYGYNVIEVTDQGWSFNLKPIDEESEVDPTSHSDYLFRRYATGPHSARAFAYSNGSRPD